MIQTQCIKTTSEPANSCPGDAPSNLYVLTYVEFQKTDKMKLESTCRVKYISKS